MKFSDKLLSLVVALSMIIALALIAMIFRDLNDLWSTIIDYQEIIQSQNDKIRDLQLLVISKLNIGTGNIFGTISYNGKHDIIIELINIKSKEKTRVIANSKGEFIFKNVFSDVYKLWAYEDINTVSMNYFNGTLNPLKLSPDT